MQFDKLLFGLAGITRLNRNMACLFRSSKLGQMEKNITLFRSQR